MRGKPSSSRWLATASSRALFFGAIFSALVATMAVAQPRPARQVATHPLLAPERLGVAPYQERRPVQATSSWMSCTTARLIMTPLGAVAGAGAGLLLYGILDVLGGEPEAATTDDLGVQETSSDLLRVVVVGGGIGAIWGFVAPPIARHCWISLPRPKDARPPRGPTPLPNPPDP